ncbi:MAG: PAS domain S-box protein [Thermomicrobiales bacterium]
MPIQHLALTPPIPHTPPRAVAGPAGAEAPASPPGMLEALFLSCPDPIIGKSPEGTITFWNPAAERLYGYSAREAVGQSIALIVPPGQMDELARRLRLVSEGHMVQAYETVRRAADGRLLDISLTIFPVRDAAGQIVGSGAVARDITEHRRDAAALAASQRRFRAAFGDAANGMALVGLDGRFLQVNRAACALLGRSQTDLQNTRIDDIVHPDDAERDSVAADRALLQDGHGYSHELRVQRPDGRSCWVRMQVSLVRDEDGQPDYFMAQLQDETERIAAREKLAAARRTVQDVLERVGSAFLELDADWRIVRVNAEGEALLGLHRSELLGSTLQDVVSAAALAPIAGALETTMTTRQPVQIAEFLCGRSNLWLSLHAYPTEDGVAILLRDITVMRHLQQELRVAELRFQTLVDQLPAAVFMFADDVDQSTFYLNPYFKQLTGYTNEDDELFHSFSSWLTFIHPDDRPRVTRSAREREGRTGQYMLEYRLRRADGSYIWVNDYYASLSADDGETVAWLGVIIDVTERKAASEVIAQLAAIVEASDDVIFTRTLDGNITYWNPAAERLYGYTAAEVLGQPTTILFPEGAERQIATVADFADRQSMRFETQDRRKDGTLVDVAATVFPVRDEAGQILGISGIARDITARKEAERELRAALEAAEAGARAKGLFLAMMSHELRTPLQAVMGYADFLLSGRQGVLSPAQLEDIGYIHLGAHRMVALIEQMLDLSRMEAGRLDLKQEPVDVRRVMELVRQDVAPQAAAKNLQLSLQAPQRLPRALGDPERVRQILLNLAGNAVKFTESGEVQMIARQRQGRVEIAVTDTGIGIAASEIPHIFEEFRQVDGKLSRRYGGAGLGLAIARRLARQMNGEITVQSAPGSGSTFTLCLPLAAAATDRAGAVVSLPAGMELP